MATETASELDQLQKALIPLHNCANDYDPLLRMCKNRSLILMGEATHGTHEFYETRVEITKRLILDQGLQAVAVEADWPAAYRVNRYVNGIGKDTTAQAALADFKRFPLWMWRNTVILEFVDWLREYNQSQPAELRVGFYGLDMYSLYESIGAVLEYLDRVDPEAAEEARRQYGCLDHLSSEQRYGFGVTMGRRPSCEKEVVDQLVRLRENAPNYVREDGMLARDELFQAEQNARLVRNAEHYYRAMFGDRISTWNLRDRHMSDTLEALQKHLSQRSGKPARIAVWEHNSHLGDARATQMGDRDEFNVGQLARERAGDDALLVGFTTHSGSVSAASAWDGPVERKAVRPALPESYEGLFHEMEANDFFLELGSASPEVLHAPRLERAIGVLYLPRTERQSHYFRCRLPEQFDAVFHFDRTRALQPMDNVSEWSDANPETYPFGV
ncbi:erythromycin esterase family protein [Marinobacter fonticola]|uniref:erythromycin esterase family protein n=1 Tax=Marinobacter fonticola TaxID=2603215 RepID=UPI0011E754A3|nr:erythromycin esterase family protein [Marinobacter fonticola]